MNKEVKEKVNDFLELAYGFKEKVLHEQEFRDGLIAKKILRTPNHPEKKSFYVTQILYGENPIEYVYSSLSSMNKEFNNVVKPHVYRTHIVNQLEESRSFINWKDSILVDEFPEGYGKRYVLFDDVTTRQYKKAGLTLLGRIEVYQYDYHPDLTDLFGITRTKHRHLLIMKVVSEREYIRQGERKYIPTIREWYKPLVKVDEYVKRDSSRETEYYVTGKTKTEGV